jgi:ornithine carbamoyltransferase
MTGHRPFTGKSMGMIFQKRSTRTRMSAEVAWNLLGGHAVFLGSTDIHLGVEESVGDTARVLSHMNDCLLARVYAHQDVVDMASAASIPVINALSNSHHPLQALADYMILQESFRRQDLSGLDLAWVGDGNNVCNSYLILGANLGCNMRVATPPGYEVQPSIRKHVAAVSELSGARILYSNDPLEACQGAEVIATDTWVSMGDEAEQAKRLSDFEGFQVTEQMGAVAKPNWKFLHCLPRKKYEVSDEVFYNPKRSVVWDEAENRLWTLASVCLALLRGKL